MYFQIPRQYATRWPRDAYEISGVVGVVNIGVPRDAGVPEGFLNSGDFRVVCCSTA
jgi:hypothetical protein